MTAAHETPEYRVPPDEVLAWADSVGGMLGEEGENSLIFEDNDQKMMQIHGDTTDAKDEPFVMLWHHDPDGRYAVSSDGHVEMRRDLTPSEALDLAAALIVQASRATDQARWKAEDRADEEARRGA